MAGWVVGWSSGWINGSCKKTAHAPGWVCRWVAGWLEVWQDYEWMGGRMVQWLDQWRVIHENSSRSKMGG